MDDQDDCMTRIQPLLPALHGVFHDAMAMYHSEYPPVVLAQHRSRTAKGCVFDHAFHALRERLDGTAGCHFLDIRGLEVLNFKDLAVIRLKHVDGAGRSRNVRTRQQEDYDDQVSFLPNLPDEAKRLVIGYETDAAFRVVDRVMVTRPWGWGAPVLWTAQINMFEEKASWTDITPARIAGTGPIDIEMLRRRRRR